MTILSTILLYMSWYGLTFFRPWESVVINPWNAPPWPLCNLLPMVCNSILDMQRIMPERRFWPANPKLKTEILKEMWRNHLLEFVHSFMAGIIASSIPFLKFRVGVSNKQMESSEIPCSSSQFSPEIYILVCYKSIRYVTVLLLDREKVWKFKPQKLYSFDMTCPKLEVGCHRAWIGWKI